VLARGELQLKNGDWSEGEDEARGLSAIGPATRPACFQFAVTT